MKSFVVYVLHLPGYSSRILIYQEDLPKCEFLGKKKGKKKIEFVWEKL